MSVTDSHKRLVNSAPLTVHTAGVPTPLFRPTQLAERMISPLADNAVSPKPLPPLNVATSEITRKAAAIGAGASTAALHQAGSGYGESFQNNDVYYSAASGVHEVHGDIRVKYNDLGGATSALGLPTTDESGSPDGSGRYNHFQGGSIYWSPNTGPMMVRPPIRDVWANQGWEMGALSYPVADEYSMITTSSSIHPTTRWSLFENGAVVTSTDGTAEAFAAEVSPDALRGLIRGQFDAQFHTSPDNVGLQPQVDTVSVSNWTYDLWRSGTRHVTFRLYGFHDNGLAPDTNFTAEVELGFGLVWPDEFGEPGTKTLVAGLFSVSVHASGLGASSVASGVKDGIWKGFYPAGGAGPDPLRPYIHAGWRSVTEVPTGARQDGAYIDVIGILVTADGGLQILVNPLPAPAGGFRKLEAQRAIDALIAGD